MTTTTTPPSWMEDSPTHTYRLAASDPDGAEVQGAELTLNEYDSLKQHLAKLRGLTSEEDGAATRPSQDSATSAPAEPTAAKDDTPEPQTITAQLAIDAFQGCINKLGSIRRRMLWWQAKVRNTVDDLAGATILDQILDDWEGGCFSDKFPKEHGLLSAIRGNLDL